MEGCEAGGEIHLSLQVENRGGLDAMGVKVSLLSSNSDETILLAERTVDVPAQTRSAGFELTVPYSGLLSESLQVVVDNDNAAQECNESNNELTLTIDCSE